MEADFDRMLDGLEKSLNTYTSAPDERYKDIRLSAMNARLVVQLAEIMYNGVFINKRRERACALILRALNAIPNGHEEHPKVERYYNKIIQLCEYVDFVENHRKKLGRAIEYTFATELFAFVEHFSRTQVQAT